MLIIGLPGLKAAKILSGRLVDDIILTLVELFIHEGKKTGENTYMKIKKEKVDLGNNVHLHNCKIDRNS